MTVQGLRDPAHRRRPPGIPVEGQQAIVDWVRDGGTLASVSGAGQGGRYDEPCALLSRATGVQEPARPRLLVADTRTLNDVGHGTGKRGPLRAVGVRSVLMRDGKLDFQSANGDIRFLLPLGSADIVTPR
jgi:hypothetical protein